MERLLIILAIALLAWAVATGKEVWRRGRADSKIPKPDPRLAQAQQEVHDLRRLLWAEREKVEKLEKELERAKGGKRDV